MDDNIITTSRFERISASLNNSSYRDKIIFFNMGYMPDSKKSETTFKLPDFLINKNSIRLILEIIGDTDLKNKNIIDIGCGRGGTIRVVNKYFYPKELAGIDLSKSSIDYCKASNLDSNATFYLNAAEKMTFHSQTFDVALIIEMMDPEPSSFSIYNETHRVLKEDGLLLQSGVFKKKNLKETLEMINTLFTIVLNIDITSNVLLSAASNFNSRANLLSRISSDKKMIDDFLIAPRTDYFKLLEKGETEYRILKMQKK